jgi:hypothetical protein
VVTYGLSLLDRFVVLLEGRVHLIDR